MRLSHPQIRPPYVKWPLITKDVPQLADKEGREIESSSQSRQTSFAAWDTRSEIGS